MRYAVVCIMYINIKFHYTLLILYCTLHYYFNKFRAEEERNILYLYLQIAFLPFTSVVSRVVVHVVCWCGGGAPAPLSVGGVWWCVTVVMLMLYEASYVITLYQVKIYAR